MNIVVVYLSLVPIAVSYVQSQTRPTALFGRKVRSRLSSVALEDAAVKTASVPRIDTYLDIFSSKDSTVGLLAFDEPAPFPVEENPSVEGSAPDSTVLSIAGSFVLPDIGAWKSVVPAENPPDILTYFRTGILSSKHEQKVMELWTGMRNRGSLRRFSEADVNRIIQALRIAYVAMYGKRTLRSLEVLINRARGTGAILGEWKADVEVIVAGLLHDILSEIPSLDVYKEIRTKLLENFGDEAVNLIESYSRLPRFNARKAEYTDFQSENQIEMLVAHAEDYRALYIRLADRLHTMRVLKDLPIDPSEMKKVAQEALNVYAPLAHKMGIVKVKGELEDLAFRVLEPELFQMSKYTQIAAHKAFHEASEQIQDLMANDEFLSSHNVTYRLTSRVKDKYQLALKMKRKNLKSMNDVRDALGLRIIIDTPRREGEEEDLWKTRGEALCYHIVQGLRELKGWRPATDGFKDYIKCKKENGYASLHQYIRNVALGTSVEIQVRTVQMHLAAEVGDAAHWNYKDLLFRPAVANSKNYRLAWRSHEQAKAKTPAELIGLAKKQLNAARVFVFLEDSSTVLSIRKGATCLDAAFSIHTDIGLSAASISIDGKPVPFNRQLVSGDTVSVQFSKGTVTAKPIWMQHVNLPYTKAVLRKHFNENYRLMLAVLGSAQLLMMLHENKLKVLTRFHGKYPTAIQLNKYANTRTGMRNIGEVLVHLGTASVATAAITIGKLLDIPSENLEISPAQNALIWARSRRELDDQDLVVSVLEPLKGNVLPMCGFGKFDDCWHDLVGEKFSMKPAVSEKEKYSVRKSFGRVGEVHEQRRVPSMFKLAQRPYSLEACSMPQPLHALARKAVAEFISRQKALVSN